MNQLAPPTDLAASPAAAYLSSRLDGARDLYVLALGLGERDGGPHTFGAMIREARLHFVAVLEEARLAGLDTQSIAAVLSESSVEDALRPDVHGWVEELLADASRRH